MQLLDFARFLDLQTIPAGRTEDELGLAEDRRADISAGAEEWDALFIQPDAREAMRTMAREALSEYHAGRTTEIVVTDDGRLAPA